MSLRDELTVVEAIGLALVELSVTSSLGPLERQDAAKGKLRVDFTFDEALPNRLAIEISSVVESRDEAAADATAKLLEECRRVAKQERLGSWLIGVRPHQDVRLMRVEILAAMRSRTAISVDQFNPPFFPPDERSAVTDDYERLRERLIEAGVFMVWRDENRPFDHTVNIFGMYPVRMITGFDHALLARVEDNRTKLGETLSSETHLVVPVLTSLASDDPRETGVPILPHEVDYLWVVHRIDETGRAHGWWIKRGGAAWSPINPGDLVPR